MSKTRFYEEYQAVNPTRKDGGRAGGRAAIAMMSPGGRCWICERLLPNFPEAAMVEGPGVDLFYLVCSNACGGAVVRELAALGVTVKLLDATTAFSRYLEASRRTMYLLSNQTYREYRQGYGLVLREVGPEDKPDKLA